MEVLDATVSSGWLIMAGACIAALLVWIGNLLVVTHRQEREIKRLQKMIVKRGEPDIFAE